MELQDIKIFSEITDWRDLQNKTCILFKQIGLIAETEKTIETPRGKIEIDVYAYDPQSVDRIIYNVECKNWNKRISQNVVMAFRTQMNETGANIGYIISKKGFQSGAMEQAQNTNVRLYTFDDFQRKYLEVWIENYFMPELYSANDTCYMYCEVFNAYRDRHLANLDESKKQLYVKLVKKYSELVNIILQISTEYINFKFHPYTGLTSDLEKLFDILKKYNPDFEFDKLNNLLIQIKLLLQNIQKEFTSVFGENLFE